jgi:hypothetical protein
LPASCGLFFVHFIGKQMNKYAHSDVLDGGLNAIRNNAIRMLLLKAYTAGDSFATVAGNAICTVTLASGDFTLSGGDIAARVLTTTAKSGTASASGTSTAIAFTDNVGKVLWVTAETSGQAVTSGNTVNFPSLTYTSGQPT